MTTFNPEQLTDELIKRIKTNASLLDLPKSREMEEFAHIIQTLNLVPKTKPPVANFERVKNQILDRITIPKEEPVNTTFGMIMQSIPRFVRIGGGIIGSFLILASLSISAAVVALESVPGQTMYPVKKAVENVQLTLASDTEKAQLEIKFANNRLEELEKVLEQNKQGKISSEAVKKVVENTVNDIAKATNKISGTSASNPDQPNANILAKVVDLSNKQAAILETAKIETEGEVKIELEKALEATKISHEQAIENMEKAGLKLEDNPLVIDTTNSVTANGEITAVNSVSITIGSVKFLLTNDTKFVNLTQDELKVKDVVAVKGLITDSKTYASEVKGEAKPADPTPTEEPKPEDPQPTQNP